MPRSDPIRRDYFDAVAQCEDGLSWIFYLGAVLSFASVLIDSTKHPTAYAVVLVAFAISVIALFAVGLVLRLYLVPRADDKRRQDFFSSAFGIALTHQSSDGYYNNESANPIKRIAAQVLENSFFSKAIALRMARSERTRIAFYTTVWLICVFNRRTELTVVVAASQAVFGEQILARWIRLEWLRMRFERTFDDVYRLFTARPQIAKFNAMALDAFGVYETAKSSAAISLDSRIFDELNSPLTVEWDRVRAKLAI
jgi:hypothetical protein